MRDIQINAELPGDADAIRCVHRSAFGQDVEGAIVDALRNAGALSISLVARSDDQIVGHVALSPMQMPNPAAKVLGLGPIGVLPEQQRGGIGTALMHAAIERARAGDFDGIVVLGHPEYYPRFGFVPASRFGIRSEYDVPDDVFMALEFNASGLTDCAGLARYHAAFAIATA
jgi:putative acetyltransferase